MRDVQYVLDANVFIEAARKYYAFDVAPAFWSSLVTYGRTGVILSIDRVKRELDRGADELSAWANTSFRDHFASTDDADVITAYGEVMNWVQRNNQFTNEAKARVADGADCWLVAYAKAKGCIVVTHEQRNPFARRRIPIPTLCQAFAVSFTNTYEMMRTIGISLDHVGVASRGEALRS